MILYLMKKDQYCRCEKGEYVSKITSEHSNEEEDRWFEIQCASVYDLNYPDNYALPNVW